MARKNLILALSLFALSVAWATPTAVHAQEEQYWCPAGGPGASGCEYSITIAEFTYSCGISCTHGYACCNGVSCFCVGAE